ncbi:unnamed protein product [Thlaspi arvense]|uniref:S-protein homolog n=1 Tax=Thlaspi arvense TaxID=13288 RepID=A0AAU9RTD0_THLAR|nr:unnamed protein product [Thlaspi arvense]CAH2050186.1 unnamed protein product [Thlaspi arvense]
MDNFKVMDNVGLLLILFLCSAHTTQSLNGEQVLELHDIGLPGRSNIHFGPKYTVHIIDVLTNGDLTFHCKSKDTDLGKINATSGEDYHFSFYENIFGRTLFFCGFAHNQQRQSFDVFDGALKMRCVDCYWRVRDDGFYFSDDGISYLKQYSWIG